MGGDFSQREVSWHINVKEAVALENSLALFCASNLDEIKGKTVIVKVDNQVHASAILHGREWGFYSTTRNHTCMQKIVLATAASTVQA